MTTPPTHRTGARRAWLLAAAALAVVAVVALVLVTRAGDGGRTPGEAAGGTSAGPTTDEAMPTVAPPTGTVEALPTPEPTGPTGDADVLPPTVAPVAFDEPAEVDGVTAEVAAVRAFDGEASGPGNVAGPALAVTVRIGNGTSAPVSLGGLQVTLDTGSDQVPASPLDDPAAAPVSGLLDAGASAEGTYVFSVPADQLDTVRVTVGHEAGAPLLVFTGSVR
jgi:hypothetical protein